MTKYAKYKHCIIKKKIYYLCQITWYDILGDTGHSSFDEFFEMKPAIICTNAYVFSKNKKFLKTFSSYDLNHEFFSDRNCIPIGCVINLKKLLNA